jgi:hypothetical protein
MAPWPNLLPCTISFYDHSGLWIWVPHGVMCTWSAYGKANSIPHHKCSKYTLPQVGHIHFTLPHMDGIHFTTSGSSTLQPKWIEYTSPQVLPTWGDVYLICLWQGKLHPSVVMCTWSICGDVYLIHLWWGVLDPLVRSTCGEVYSIHLGWSVLDPLVVKCIPCRK